MSRHLASQRHLTWRVSIRMTDAGHHPHRHQHRQALADVHQTVQAQGDKLVASTFSAASFLLGTDHGFSPVWHVKASDVRK